MFHHLILGVFFTMVFCKMMVYYREKRNWISFNWTRISHSEKVCLCTTFEYDVNSYVTHQRHGNNASWFHSDDKGYQTVTLFMTLSS